MPIETSCAVHCAIKILAAFGCYEADRSMGLDGVVFMLLIAHVLTIKGRK